MIITLQTWMLPAAFTLILAASSWLWMSNEETHGAYSFPIRPLIGVPAFIIGSLTAWLFWALLG